MLVHTVSRNTPFGTKLTLFLASFMFTTASMAEGDHFRAGASKREITPREPVPMWGYGARHDQLSMGTLDPLYASAVVIQAGDKKIAIVGLDLGRFPSEASLVRIRERIRRVAGIEHSMIAGSHTHHGPVLELSDEVDKGRGRFDAAIRYYEQMEDAIVGAIVESDQRLVPAKLAVGSIELPGITRNRHTKFEPKPVDPLLSVIRLDEAGSDKPIALLVNFTGHPTSIPAKTLQFSADYVGALKAAIERDRGGTAVFMQGASGDISIDKGAHPDHVAYGAALGGEAVKLAQSLTPQIVARPSLEVREQRFCFESRTNLNNPLVLAAYSLAFFPELVRNFADEYAEGVRPRLTVAILNGDVGLVGASGEFFCQHAVRLRERARMGHLLFFGYCNGYHQYFPTIEAAAEGGYGADSQVAPAAIGAGEQLMNSALTWLYEIRGKF